MLILISNGVIIFYYQASERKTVR